MLPACDDHEQACTPLCPHRPILDPTGIVLQRLQVPSPLTRELRPALQVKVDPAQALLVQGCRVHLPLLSKQQGGHKSSYPIKLYYSCTLVQITYSPYRQPECTPVSEL